MRKMKSTSSPMAKAVKKATAKSTAGVNPKKVRKK